jgi:hypothetical protein
MRARMYLAQCALLIGTVAVVGCSKGPSGTFGTVAGTVTHNGTAVDGARIEFHSTTESEGGKRDSFATTTDSSGKYMIGAVGKNPGIPIGMYKVVITKYDLKNNPNAGKEGFDAGQLEAQQSDGGGGGKSPINNFLPKEYATVGTSKLSATIQEGKNEGVNFDLKGKP